MVRTGQRTMRASNKKGDGSNGESGSGGSWVMIVNERMKESMNEGAMIKARQNSNCRSD